MTDYGDVLTPRFAVFYRFPAVSGRLRRRRFGPGKMSDENISDLLVIDGSVISGSTAKIFEDHVYEFRYLLNDYEKMQMMLIEIDELGLDKNELLSFGFRKPSR